jgi:hypothetical protein
MVRKERFIVAHVTMHRAGALPKMVGLNEQCGRKQGAATRGEYTPDRPAEGSVYLHCIQSRAYFTAGKIFVQSPG